MSCFQSRAELKSPTLLYPYKRTAIYTNNICLIHCVDSSIHHKLFLASETSSEV